jgi:asparagine synthetase B (glutamine-hydrolysing)
MCGIIISSLKIPEKAYKFVERRGPDETNIKEYKNINFVHFLLHLTGIKTLQPVIEDDIVCIFNGEIYNYKELNAESKSDVYSIIFAYNKYGNEFTRYLDGEFTIVLFDFKKGTFIISGDIFKTKPLFYNVDEDIVISSYESSCKSIKYQKYTSIKPNETLIFDLKTRKLLEKKKICEFDLKQKKDNYDDFVKALEKSILKRYPEDSIPLVGVSSGLDSGAISLCLRKHNKPALFISFPKNEDINVLKARQEILKPNHLFLDINPEEKAFWKKDLMDNCEKFTWDFSVSKELWESKEYHEALWGWRRTRARGMIHNGMDMGSMLARSKMIAITKQIEHSEGQKIRVLYSGIGADEVMAHNSYYDCGWGNVHEFPEDLKDVFPWHNFFGGTMDNYIKGDEYVGGCYGFETRYPFCDKELIQEFLWLKPELKNDYKGSNYKPPLLYYLHSHGFPINIRKLGFDP